MKTNKWMAVAAVAALAWAGAAAAQGPRGHGRHHGGFGPLGGLDLTEAQQEQVKALHEKRQAEIQPLMEQARAARRAFDKALAAEGADPATVGEAALAMKAAREKMHAAHQALRADLEKILTDEQREQLGKREGRGFGRRGGPRHGGHHPGGPAGPPPDQQ
ncbi:MAG: periplasmic heavy metal sensor [Vicinamibacteria bacterium]|nr:periplasmic heavy metal sensor [Vicinamibacteria bacterium]